jgi:hypothetical protein
MSLNPDNYSLASPSEKSGTRRSSPLRPYGKPVRCCVTESQYSQALQCAVIHIRIIALQKNGRPKGRPLSSFFSGEQNSRWSAEVEEQR